MLAKVSKLLSLAEKGKLHEYAGKSLDEIEITPEDVIDDELVDGEEDEEEECEADMEENEAANPEDDMEDGAGPSSSSTTDTTAGRKYNKWTQQQEEFLLAQKNIQKHIKRKSTPGKLEGQLTIERRKGVLSDKSWKEIKDKVHYINQKEHRNLKKKIRD